MRATRHSGEPVRVLLGGGIGCGKSLAGRRFAELGAVVVDSDKIGHAVIAAGGEAEGAVGHRWPVVMTEFGIDRTRLGRMVFGNASELRELEAMTHPAIVRRIVAIAEEAGNLVVEVPLILEVPGDWTTVYVDASPERCLRRAVDRGLDEESVRRRMDHQPHRCEWSAWADQMLDNNGTPEELVERVDKLWTELLA